MSKIFTVKESWHTDALGQAVMRWEINGVLTDAVTAHPVIPIIQMPICDYAPGGDVATIVLNGGDK